MDFYTVIDTGAFVWDIDESGEPGPNYYPLTSLFIDFLKVMEDEKPKILLRNELKTKIWDEFPWEIQGIHNFWELSRTLAAFLGNANVSNFEHSPVDDTTSTPDIVYEYYKNDIKTEVRYLVREIHSSESEIKYFTFCPIWNKDTVLRTVRAETEKEYETIVHCNDELQNFFESLKPKFIHSTKHDRLIRRIDITRGYRLVDNKKIYPFSANYSDIPNHAQNLLNLAINHDLEPDKLYYYDDDSHTFVCFVRTGGRVFHGFDVPEADLHEPIQAAVMQKVDEQKQN